MACDMGLPSESRPHRNRHPSGGEGVGLQAAVTMTEPAHRHLVIWEARHDNGWTTLVIEQSDGTSVAWAGPDESGASIMSRTAPSTRRRRRCLPSSARAATPSARRAVRGSRCGCTRCSNRRQGGLRATLQSAVKSRRSSRYSPLSFARATVPPSFLGLNCKDFSSFWIAR